MPTLTGTQINRSLLLALAALLLAAGAQYALSTADRFTGWILYLAGAIFSVLAFRMELLAQFAGGRLRAPNEYREDARPAFRVLLLLAVLGMFISIVYFGREATMPAAWIIHMLSLALFIAAVELQGRRRRGRHPKPRALLHSVRPWLPGLVLVCAAALVRLWQLDSFPFGTWYDEAVNGLIARQILAEPAFRPLYHAGTQLPTHFNYLIALAFSIFGDSTWSVRLVSTFFGILAVLFAYLLFRRWFGAGIGIVAALLLAFMRYHLTFSRFGLNGISTPAFEFAAIYFLDRMLANKRVKDFAWFGIVLGLSLGFYLALRLFLLVIVIFLLILLIAALLRYGRRVVWDRFVRGLWMHWCIAALAFLVAALPVLQLAFRHPEFFLARSNTVSIFTTRDEPDLGKALWSNTYRHLEMFNLHGDRNGRHNLPSEPMVDPVLGVLFVLGLGLAVWRWRDPANALMLLVFVGLLMAGILSLDFEAPQSYRSIGVIPAVLYFSCLPLAALWGVAGKLFARKRPPSGWGLHPLLWRARIGIGIALVATLVGVIAMLELRTFFVRQQRDASAWAQYSAAETLAANEINTRGTDFDFVVSTVYFDPPTVRFLVRPGANVRAWTVTDRLPLLRDDVNRGVVLLFDNNLLSSYRDAQRLYPSAEFIEHRSPYGGGPVMFEAILSPEVLRSALGVEAAYYAGDTVGLSPSSSGQLDGLSLDWSTSAPLTGPFVAELRSTVVAPEYGDYTFEMRGDLDAELWIDEYPVQAAPVTLARGTHAIRLVVSGGRGKVSVFWKPPTAAQAQPIPSQNLFVPPITNSGLLGSYFPTPDWSGPPAFTQVDSQLAYYFHVIPLPRPYSVRWTGKLYVPSTGTYELELYSVDGSQLLLDNVLALENPEGRQSVKVSLDLTQGWHEITVNFQDRTSGTQIYLYWTPPGGSRDLIPSKFFLPPMGAYPPSP